MPKYKILTRLLVEFRHMKLCIQVYDFITKLKGECEAEENKSQAIQIYTDL